MLFHKLKFSGLLSFGSVGIDLPMEPLNVLIGPNGSGKSNLLEAISLFQAAPRGISEPISRAGGVREWLWKGPEASRSIRMEVMCTYRNPDKLRHALTLADQSDRVIMADEQIELPKSEQIILPEMIDSDRRDVRFYCRPPRDKHVELDLAKENARRSSESEPPASAKLDSGIIHFRENFHPEESLLSHAASPTYPALWYLKEQYRKIRLYRNWSFGPDTKLRQPCSAHERSDFLDEGGGNLPLVLSQLHGTHKKSFLTALSKLFDGIVDIQCPVTGGTVALFLEEAGNRSIPATRLSDGTLRYLCLLAVLLHPEPPPLICIEEPELGLHPDLLPTLSDLMREASERTQLIVTTHSDVLVDTLTDRPESVVVCEKHDGQTEMRRLDKDDLAKWLEDYRLGDLWTSGELGGNRW